MQCNLSLLVKKNKKKKFELWFGFDKIKLNGDIWGVLKDTVKAFDNINKVIYSCGYFKLKRFLHSYSNAGGLFQMF